MKGDETWKIVVKKTVQLLLDSKKREKVLNLTARSSARKPLARIVALFGTIVELWCITGATVHLKHLFLCPRLCNASVHYDGGSFRHGEQKRCEPGTKFVSASVRLSFWAQSGPVDRPFWHHHLSCSWDN